MVFANRVGNIDSLFPVLRGKVPSRRRHTRKRTGRDGNGCRLQGGRLLRVSRYHCLVWPPGAGCRRHGSPVGLVGCQPGFPFDTLAGGLPWLRQAYHWLGKEQKPNPAERQKLPTRRNAFRYNTRLFLKPYGRGGLFHRLHGTGSGNGSLHFGRAFVADMGCARSRAVQVLVDGGIDSGGSGGFSV